MGKKLQIEKSTLKRVYAFFQTKKNELMTQDLSESDKERVQKLFLPI